MLTFYQVSFTLVIWVGIFAIVLPKAWENSRFLEPTRHALYRVAQILALTTVFWLLLAMYTVLPALLMLGFDQETVFVTYIRVIQGLAILAVSIGFIGLTIPRKREA